MVVKKNLSENMNLNVNNVAFEDMTSKKYFRSRNKFC